MFIQVIHTVEVLHLMLSYTINSGVTALFIICLSINLYLTNFN